MARVSCAVSVDVWKRALLLHRRGRRIAFENHPSGALSIMFVGVLRLHLAIVDARSLKDKRRVVRSLKDRLTQKLRVSVGEVGELDHPKYATIGVAVVSNEAAHCDSVLAEAASMASNLPDAVLHDRRTEIVSFGRGGTGVSGGIEQSLQGVGSDHSLYANDLDLEEP